MSPQPSPGTPKSSKDMSLEEKLQDARIKVDYWARWQAGSIRCGDCSASNRCRPKADID
jgi:hypothetical protein